MSTLPSHTLLPMPSLSPTMTSGNLAAWKLKEGDSFGAGDVLAEVETDKATVDYESVDDGIIAKILVPEGAQDIAINTPIAVVVVRLASSNVRGMVPIASRVTETTPIGIRNSSAAFISAACLACWVFRFRALFAAENMSAADLADAVEIGRAHV